MEGSYVGQDRERLLFSSLLQRRDACHRLLLLASYLSSLWVVKFFCQSARDDFVKKSFSINSNDFQPILLFQFPYIYIYIYVEKLHMWSVYIVKSYQSFSPERNVYFLTRSTTRGRMCLRHAVYRVRVPDIGTYTCNTITRLR